MADRPPSGAPSVADAEVAIARLAGDVGRSARLRDRRSGRLDPRRNRQRRGLAAAATDVIAAADAAAGEPVTHAHVGTEDGEVFVVRARDYMFVAAAERFALAGLMVFDIRAALRDLVRGPDAVVAMRREAA